MPPIPTLRFKPDKALRRRLFVPEAMSFPAKAHIGMMLEIFERYTQGSHYVIITTDILDALDGRVDWCDCNEGTS